MIKVDCKKYADEILDRVSQIKDKGGLVIVTAGDDPASQIYMKGKLKDAERCGIRASKIEVGRGGLKNAVNYGNTDPTIHGIIIQLPLPEYYDEKWATNLVDRDKDVDGFQYGSLFKPCTPEGIMYILHKELGDLTGKTALVIGRGKLVGEPIAKMLLDADCTVTVAHSKTKDLDELLWRYDIVVSAVGKRNLIDLNKCEAEIVIDAGGDCYNFDPDDEFDMKVAMAPGGIGLMTRAVLMAHVARMDIWENFDRMSTIGD